jgi:hypothetical protein
MAMRTLFVFIFACHLAMAAPAWVQNSANIHAATVSISGSTAGNLLIGFQQWPSNATITSCTGSSGTWSVGPQIFDPTNTESIGTCYQFNTAGGTQSVTFNWSVATAADGPAAIIEFSGVSTSSPFDGSNSHVNAGSTTANAHTCGAISTTFNGDLIASIIIDTTLGAPAATFTAGTGFTIHYSSNAAPWVIDTAEEDLVQSTHGSITPTWTASNTDRTACVGLAFKATGATAGAGLFEQSLMNGITTGGPFFPNPIGRSNQPDSVGIWTMVPILIARRRFAPLYFALYRRLGLLDRPIPRRFVLDLAIVGRLRGAESRRILAGTETTESDI